jgi:hypothetical protein
MPFDRNEIIALMQSGIEKFRQDPAVTQSLKAFDDAEFADPLFHWSTMKCGDELDLLALLNNWYNVTTPIGALGDNIQYVQMCYEGVIRTDATFNKLFRTNWSRDVIEGGRSLFANAVPGVWMNDSALGELDSRIYVRGFDAIWLPIIDAIRPPVIYLCGAWAKPLAKSLREGLRYSARVEVKCHPVAYGRVSWANRDNLSEE